MLIVDIPLLLTERYFFVINGYQPNPTIWIIRFVPSQKCTLTSNFLHQFTIQSLLWMLTLLDMPSREFPTTLRMLNHEKRA